MLCVSGVYVVAGTSLWGKEGMCSSKGQQGATVCSVEMLVWAGVAVCGAIE